jgi:hypothetical protein
VILNKALDVNDSARRLRFAAEIAKGNPVIRAARTAGYSESFANTKAYKLARQPDFVELVEDLRVRALEALVLDVGVVVNQIGAISTTNPTDLLMPEPVESMHGKKKIAYRWKSPDELTPMQRAAVRTIEVVNVYQDVLGEDKKTVVGRELVAQHYHYTFHDKVKALEMLGRHFGAFLDGEPPPVPPGGEEDYSDVPHEQMVEAVKFLQALKTRGTVEIEDGEVLPDD